jgi:hypothetical protein
MWGLYLCLRGLNTVKAMITGDCPSGVSNVHTMHLGISLICIYDLFRLLMSLESRFRAFSSTVGLLLDAV